MPERARLYMGQCVTSFPPKRTRPLRGGDQPAGHAKGGRLAGPVWPQKPHDLAPVDMEIDIVDGPLAWIILDESNALQQGHLESSMIWSRAGFPDSLPGGPVP